ncbi:periplasmic binding protein/LacI transcriptional regulator [Opitutus terrae PB90-1]|uniref:Periplasmic binding protein/LacI transcriptional regulator n=2 Tax=Opitutus terrae TaxID=107709 RepID=B1ZN87_OPITP|nr:periplasmic binding protein/LacI transcriptional regulator [Opitutus terrae PB90-1]
MKFLQLSLLMVAAFLARETVAAVKIGVLLKDRDLFWSAAEKGALDAARAAGAEVIVKAPLTPNSLSQQLAMLNALLKEPIDALVVAPLTPEDFRGPIEALRAKGVKIVALDTALPEGLADVFVGYNQVVMAEDAGRFLAELVPDGDRAALLRANSIEGMSVREKTLIATFRAARGQATLYTDVVAGSEKQDDYAKSVMLLERHPNVRAVCTPFSAASLAMIRALQDKGLAGKVLQVGFGSSLPDAVATAIENGSMAGWVAQQPRLIGSKGVEAAVQLLAGQTLPASLDVPYFLVTKANLNTAEVQAIRR